MLTINNRLADRDVPNVANANENTTCPTSADNTVASPTAVWAALLCIA